MSRLLLPLIALLLTSAVHAAETLTVYSGRNERLVGPLYKAFTAKTGIEVKVRYGETPQLVATLMEEGAKSPADVFVAQDAGALGALAKAQLLQPLPKAQVEKVDARFRSPEALWVGLSGRARVVAYNTAKVKPEQLPTGIQGFTEPAWKGRIGWAPTNGSFQAFVTALRLMKGDAAAKKWLEGVKANAPRTYKNNAAIVEALGRGEIDVGFVNHYYLYAAKKDQGEALPVANHFLAAGDPGTLVNVSGAAVLKSSKKAEAAQQLIAFLLDTQAQQHFAQETFEYPLVPGVAAASALPALSKVGSPDLDLSKLEDLKGTLRLLQETGVL
ncbi:iron ABC transporter substrate-binding protein [Stigmatella aurantiaca]|uniref:Bacterial extracellular solute-binding protein, putative n=1 Tax=Stigmatella aurantiaca (strain DW4/3-1) TaxID=378806 RepID=Q09DS5_STIAD|nr:iron ABC transporter substrate-binding protein [Stigmatella aurantiaca]ADO75241.1 Iron ABC transporter, periplasmic iron-binding protein [Stigmatella aurantiaca DW4/3-1]EAU69959.1 bacterial extracellular solute-binding protein, putative [Stigmatella aurantiaca DW4/3-1]